MPLYGDLATGVGATGQPACGLLPGESIYLFNAETHPAGSASIAFCRSEGATQDDAGTTFQIDAATVGVEIEGANIDSSGEYRTLYTSVAQYDNYTDTTRWRFYRSVGNGGAVTVLAQR